MAKLEHDHFQWMNDGTIQDGKTRTSQNSWDFGRLTRYLKLDCFWWQSRYLEASLAVRPWWPLSIKDGKPVAIKTINIIQQLPGCIHKKKIIARRSLNQHTSHVISQVFHWQVFSRLVLSYMYWALNSNRCRTLTGTFPSSWNRQGALNIQRNGM